jgi:predicted O-methyltransferase YrrM
VAQIAQGFLGQMDMIFCDLARGDSRVEAMPLMHDLLAPGGTIFFDDWHCAKMTEKMEPFLNSLNYEVTVLEDTVDQWDRYMAKATRCKTAES